MAKFVARPLATAALCEYSIGSNPDISQKPKIGDMNEHGVANIL